jgi:SAM-dependent methyltransferase
MGEKAYTGSFARIYDDIMGAVPYDLWYNYLHKLLKYYRKRPVKVLDLACGTGNMTLRFARNGYRVSGLDRSSEMLEIARKKTNKVKERIDFIQADLRDFQLTAEYDLAFSLFDSINYILEIQDLKMVFINVFQSLQEDGVFIFDLNTLRRLMSIKPGTTMLKGDNYTCLWEDIIDSKRKRWQVRLKIYFEEQKQYYHEEFHEETSYPVKEVELLLREVGFTHIDVFKAYTLDQARESDNRIYFVALKNFSDFPGKWGWYRLFKRINWRLTSSK